MQSEGTKWSSFKGMVLPHLEVLLQISLGLTKNGRDATRLMQETIEEAFRRWDELLPEESSFIRLHDLLVSRFLNGFQLHARPLVPIHDDKIDESLIKHNRLFPATTGNARQNSFSESDDQASILEAITGLPDELRPVMFLSFVEGISKTEIAELAGVQPQVIESLLDRGCRVVRIELFALLLGNNRFDTATNQAMKSA